MKKIVIGIFASLLLFGLSFKVYQIHAEDVGGGDNCMSFGYRTWTTGLVNNHHFYDCLCNYQSGSDMSGSCYASE
jgi:hypothetical protein